MTFMLDIYICNANTGIFFCRHRLCTSRYFRYRFGKPFIAIFSHHLHLTLRHFQSGSGFLGGTGHADCRHNQTAAHRKRNHQSQHDSDHCMLFVFPMLFQKLLYSLVEIQHTNPSCLYKMEHSFLCVRFSTDIIFR